MRESGDIPAADGDTASDHRIAAVLDTNVWLAILVFADPRTTAIERAIRAGTLDVIATPSMRVELMHVIARPALRLAAGIQADALARFDTCVSMRAEPSRSISLDDPRLGCRDPDDQVFVDAAIANGCTWLLSRDRKLLELARHARRAGLSICTPESAHLTASLALQRPT